MTLNKIYPITILIIIKLCYAQTSANDFTYPFYYDRMSQKYNTEKECLERSQAKIYLAYIDWLNWRDREIMHNNIYPKSPTYSGGRSRGNCD